MTPAMPQQLRGQGPRCNWPQWSPVYYVLCPSSDVLVLCPRGRESYDPGTMPNYARPATGAVQ